MKECIIDADIEGIRQFETLAFGKVTGELIRCKDCEDCTETKLYDGQRWNYCMRLRCVVKENDFCCWAERKYPKIKAKVTE